MRLNLLLAGSLAAIISCSFAIAQPTYEIVSVKRSAIGSNVSFAGTVKARRTVQLAAQMGGRVISIAGREGDTFGAGSVLIQLDDAALLARYQAAAASREAAMAAIENAQAQYSREVYSPRSEATVGAPGGMGIPAVADELFARPMQQFFGMRDDGIERYSDLVGARTQIAQAQTSLRQAEASMWEIDAALRDTRSVAPFDGVVSKVHVEVGDTVQPGQPIIDFDEVDTYKVETDMPVHLARSLRSGQPLPVSLGAPAQPVTAQVYRIHPVADSRRHTVRVELSIPQGLPVTAGQYVEVSVPEKNDQQVPQLTIPQQAVINKGGMAMVFAVGPQGEARLRVVRVGQTTADDRAVVLSGIEEGDQIINNPPPGLRSGTQVIPADGQFSEPGTDPLATTVPDSGDAALNASAAQ